MFACLYRRMHQLMARPGERGSYSSGRWQDVIRAQTVDLCRLSRGSLLEVGCGEGMFLCSLAQQNSEVSLWGADFNRERISQAREKIRHLGLSRVHLALAEATRLCFRPESFDTVVCINVFFNLASAAVMEQVLAEMAAVCRPGGRIIFDVRNSDNVLLRIKYRFAPWYDPTVRTLPLKTYSFSQTEQMLLRNGLKPVRACFLGFPLRKYAPLILIEARK